MHIYMHTFKYPDNTHTHTCTCRCKHTIVPTTDTNAHIYIHIDEHTCICTVTYIYIHIGTKTHGYLHTFKPTYLFFSLFIVTIVSSPREMAWKLRMQTFFQRTGVRFLEPTGKLTTTCNSSYRNLRSLASKALANTSTDPHIYTPKINKWNF